MSKVSVTQLWNFVGRSAPYAVQTGKGYAKVDNMLNNDMLKAHLDGDVTLGAYVIDIGRTCKFVMWDIDDMDANKVYQLTAQLPEPYVVEFSGKKGHHVWALFKRPIPVGDAYHYGLQVKHKAGLSEIESFPKQAGLEPGKLGNLVKVPFGIHQQTGKRSTLVHGKIAYAATPVLEQEFIPTPTIPKYYGGQTNGESSWLTDLFDGETEGNRNNAMNKFIFWLQQRGFPMELVEQNARWVNERLQPPLDEDELSVLLRVR